MIPSALSTQLEQGLGDFLRFSFWSSTPGMEHVIDDLLAQEGTLIKGPYVSIKLPFKSGRDPRYFPDVPLDFTPHLHQERAFERLGGRRKLSTLVATGTGSGKTESFLVPILDHCLSDAGNPGVKAILIYPMNALATDQASRIARLIHANDKLRGRVSAGLYIGESRIRKGGGERKMGPKTVITDRGVLQDEPPDILLTNYKMLDYLLLRPQDQGIWQHNHRGILRFLVVDEIHTFDGAQGSDLACLIRRLKRRLQADDGALCCVGTSATLGGPGAGGANGAATGSAGELRRYAEAVFGEPFDDTAVIGEARQSEAEFLAGCPIEATDEPGSDDKPVLDASRATDSEAWIRTQAELWLGELPEAGDADAWHVALGERLKRHATFQALLEALGGDVVDSGDLVARLARRRSEWRRDPELARLALRSLLGLVSVARAWRDELPDVAAARRVEGRARPVRPFLDVRLQLWQRELRRMVATVGERPRLRHSMDLDSEARRRHLPMIHCRECGAMGWAALVPRDKPHLLRTPDLDKFYRAYFGNDARVQFLYPAAAIAPEDRGPKRPAFRLDTETLTRLGPDEEPEGPALEVVAADNRRSTPTGVRLSRDCPFCRARESLALIGFQAATLTSLYIDQLFASPFNDDKKLLTFSDSVQDAAHRAGFFGSRTWRTNLRVAMCRAIREPGEGLTLARLADTLGAVWRERLDEATWVSTFLAPNMTWLHDWETLKSTGKLPGDSDLPELIATRLAFEVGAEFGLQAGIGRSLPRTGTATVALDGERLERAVELVLEPLRNEVPGLRQVSAEAVRRFLVGLLHHLRTRGGILSRSLPSSYVESSGSDVYVFSRSWALPGFTKTSRLPEFLTDRSGSPRFATWGGKSDTSWYSRWVPVALSAGDPSGNPPLRKGGRGDFRAAAPASGLPPLAKGDRGDFFLAESASTYPVVLPSLVAAGLLREQTGKKGERVWGLDEEALVITERVAAVKCERCGHRTQIAAHESETWTGMPCLRGAECSGAYTVDPVPTGDYFGRLYAAGHLERIFTEEHTGLLDRAERERVEQEFKARPGPEGDPASRRPWYANLLSCTPTLEMGIDIGDLSAAVLCSVPPGQSSYLQRIGRAGRRSGNAFVLSVAVSRPHDLYFFALPSEMMAGEVATPGVFLDAPAVLERQLTAFCVDRWVAERGAGAARLPRLLRSVFSHLEDEGTDHFPHNLFDFVEARKPILLREFSDMFASRAGSGEGAGGELSAETRAYLSRFLLGAGEKAGLRWVILDTLHRSRRQRDSLSARARSTREDLKRLREAPARPIDFEEREGELEREKDALVALVSDINQRQTLEFLTDEGLLPNYTFPESAVRLSSVIWRKKKKAPSPSPTGGRTRGSAYDTWSFEYKRSPSSALADLAPRADFYAGGRRVRIDQVDVAVSKVEQWRFCSECNHAQNIDVGDEATSCPACNSAAWRDEGQRFRLLKLQQVFANTSDRESRIRDDRDERQPKFFQRQILVDIRDQDRAGAWRVDDVRLPFGFEYLKRATFREMNFGEPTDLGAKSVIAGREAVRPGFEICSRCGKVQDSRKAKKTGRAAGKDTVQHALSCPSRKEGVEARIERCLYLYREFSSEALRLLLPITDVGTEVGRSSFVAALQLGLKSLFGGSVDHLRSTTYSDPVEGSSMRKQYLVLYDTVPGGTGYLKQLVTPRSEGAELPLFEALRRSLQHIEDCVCWPDPERDGCYRCLYPYRNSRDLGETSSRQASELLRRLLADAAKLSRVESLGQVSISGLMDSVLEARFLEALRRITRDGREARLKDAVVNQKPGHRWIFGSTEWLIEPQVEPPVSESGGVPVSIDFVMRRARDERRLAIFLDGWTYHQDRIGRDLRQRMALLASGRWDVWTFTWADLDARLTDAALDVPELAVSDPDRLKHVLQKMGRADHTQLAAKSVFEWFEEEILGDGLEWHEMARAVLAARMNPASVVDAERWSRFVEQVAPEAARPALSAMAPKLSWRDVAETHPYFALMAIHDGGEPALVCTLDDREEHREAAEFKAAWQGYLRLFQLLRRASNAWFMTATGTLESDAYQPIVATLAGTPADAAWPELGEIETPYRDLAEQLMAAGVRQPEIGMEIPERRGGTWAEAELLWEDEQVAVTSREMTRDVPGTPAAGWTILVVEELADGPAPVLAALRSTEET